MSLWISALQGQDCHTGLCLWTRKAKVHHVSHQSLTLPGLLLLSSSQGWAISSVPSQARFLSKTKTGKLTLVLHTLQRRAALGQQGLTAPLPYCMGKP